MDFFILQISEGPFANFPRSFEKIKRHDICRSFPDGGDLAVAIYLRNARVLKIAQGTEALDRFSDAIYRLLRSEHLQDWCEQSQYIGLLLT